MLASGICFYSFWDWRFTFLLVASTCLDFWCAKKIEDSKDPKVRKFFMLLSVVTSLFVLGFFKYFYFFASNVSWLSAKLGLDWSTPTLQIILPVGLSFYVLQSIGYVIDVWRGQCKAARDPILFGNFIAFFPQLVAGPIEKADHLIPQLNQKFRFQKEWIMPALVLMLIGFIKKVWIGDPLGFMTDDIFNNSHQRSSFDLWLGAVSFSLQIYFDFSGYSDIARGTARLFGVQLMENFKQPFLCTSPRDLWGRWHISLNNFIKDYLYLPIGGSRGNLFITCRNLIIAMTLTGLWHGASWNFVLFGFFHGVSLSVQRLFSRFIPGTQAFKILGGFYAIFIWLILIVFFRATSFDQAIDYIGGMWTRSDEIPFESLRLLVFILGAYLLVDGVIRWKGDFFILKTSPVYQYFFILVGWAVTLFLIFENDQRPFIYFQF